MRSLCCLIFLCGLSGLEVPADLLEARERAKEANAEYLKKLEAFYFSINLERLAPSQPLGADPRQSEITAHQELEKVNKAIEAFASRRVLYQQKIEDFHAKPIFWQTSYLDSLLLTGVEDRPALLEQYEKLKEEMASPRNPSEKRSPGVMRAVLADGTIVTAESEPKK